MTGFNSKRAMARDRLAADEDKVYEHEIVTTVRITFRSLEQYPDKQALLKDYTMLTDFSSLMYDDDYPRVVSTEVVEDEVDSFNKVVDE